MAHIFFYILQAEDDNDAATKQHCHKQQPKEMKTIYSVLWTEDWKGFLTVVIAFFIAQSSDERSSNNCWSNVSLDPFYNLLF